MRISVVGLGYVGSVATAGLAQDGHQVVGIDTDWAKIEYYRAGQAPFYEPGLSELVEAGLQRGNIRFFHSSEVREPLGDIIVIATGTPPTQTGGADLTQVKSALQWVKEKQPEGGVIVMKSTVPPGTGVRLMDTLLSGTPFDYASNPEFLREGRAVKDWFEPDRVVIGASDERVAHTVKAMYERIQAPCVITDITSAELIKYAANAFLATKISFINEVAMLCEKLGATIDDVAKGIGLDPRIGPGFLRAGVGYGGSCFPKDVRALDDLALNNGHNFDLLRSVITINNRQRILPLYSLRQLFGRLSGVRVGVLGLAFKPHTDDVRESPSIDLIRLLVEEGAEVAAYDPVAARSAEGVLPGVVRLVADPLGCAEGAQALVLMVEWPQIVKADWGRMASVMQPPMFLFDGRNALNPADARACGFQYRGVGRDAARAAAPVHAGVRG